MGFAWCDRARMAASSSQNVELEAAKFLQKLIQESKDEPAKLATKLYVVRACSLSFAVSVVLLKRVDLPSLVALIDRDELLRYCNT